MYQYRRLGIAAESYVYMYSVHYYIDNQRLPEARFDGAAAPPWPGLGRIRLIRLHYGLVPTQVIAIQAPPSATGEKAPAKITEYVTD